MAGDSRLLHPGTFFSFLTALIMLYEPIKRLTATNNQIQQGISAAERVFAIIDAVPEIRNAPMQRNFPGSQEESTSRM
jgi:subfamily B ATP-binding cassette protein MsbA